jgi:shikimate dehydrogenase
MHQAAYSALDLPYRYVAIEVPPESVGPALERLKEGGYKGVNVTVPHKKEALEWCNRVDEISRKAQAANTIDLAKRAGINTDAPGFIETVRSLELSGHNVLVIGAGGSSRAITQALVNEGYDVSIYNRTAARAADLARETGADHALSLDPIAADLIVNATSASLSGEEVELEWDRVKPTAAAYDLMYGPSVTPFLAQAAERGLRTIDGLPLLVAQGALSFEYWLGIPAPRSAMRDSVTRKVHEVDLGT